MASSSKRSTSIPRNFRKIHTRNGFDAQDAAKLQLQLRALDKRLDNIDPALGKDISPDYVEEAGEGSLQNAQSFYDFIQAQNIRRPDGLVAAYLEAYREAQHGRTYINRSRILNFVKGRECTCSEALKDVAKLDQWLGTSLAAKFSDVYDQVKPFPFLELPAELRLDIYNLLLLARPYFVLGWSEFAGQPLPEKPLLQTSKKICKEVSSSLYSSSVLYMRLRVGGIQDFLTGDLSKACDTVEQMGAHNRQFFKTLEVQVDLPYHPNPFFLSHSAAREDKFAAMLTLLSGLDTIIFLFGNEGISTPSVLWDDYEEELLEESLKYSLDRIPKSVSVEWDFRNAQHTGIGAIAEKLMATRDGVKEAQSVAAPIIERRKSGRIANIDVSLPHS